MLTLSFHGATQTVTGSRYLLDDGTRRVLVDCGLFQGYKHLRLKNWGRPAFAAEDIDAVVLTHAHLDHSGYIPLLVRQGFRGTVYATAATIELCRILLPDSGHLQEEQADFANRHGFSKHKPALPLYTQRDAIDCLDRFKAVRFGDVFAPAPGFSAVLSPAGHLLGAASVRVEAGGTSVLFSGDLGRPDDPLMDAPAAPLPARHVVIESTYGNRAHAQIDPQVQLGEAIRRAADRGGVVLVPTFAVGRAQLLLLMIARLKAAHQIPDLPVYLDSPMAIDATKLFRSFHELHRLDEAGVELLHDVATLVHTPDQSRALDRLRTPAIILSASGMATGGRVLHHLKVFVTDERNLVLFAGFQAAGTRGAALVHGAREIRIHGEQFPVRAEILQLDSVSAHADAQELLAWLKQMEGVPRQAFVTHGESEAADALRQRIEHELHWNAVVPEYRDVFELQ